MTSSIFEWPTRYSLLSLALVSLLFNLRCPEGNDGSDQMSLFVIVSTAIAELLSTTTCSTIVLFFVAGQSALAYGTSGFLKIRESGWRNGEFPTAVLATSTFGNRSVLTLFQKSRALRIIAGWSVALGDCLLAVAFALPPVVSLIILLFGVGLHIGIARILGLNTFLWAFAATYPAVYFVSNLLYRHI